jgi:hypothetical protein
MTAPLRARVPPRFDDVVGTFESFDRDDVPFFTITAWPMSKPAISFAIFHQNRHLAPRVRA